MEKMLPLFPLNLVVFPNEELNLHIFEPRYKQLINDCLREKTTFGIPSHVVNKIEFGTEVEITEVAKTYEDGRMDIKTKGLRTFKVINFQNPWQNKDYAGGTVELLETVKDEDPQLKIEILEKAKELFQWLKIENDIDLSTGEIYTFIHKIGLKPEEEYKLIQIPTQSLRQQFILNHLSKIIPMLERAEKAKEKVKMNGHFKHLDPLKF